MTVAQGPVPAKVAIVAMGGTSASYNALVANYGHRKAVFDETWVINAMATVMHHDRAFVMQDVKHNIVEEAKERKVAQGVLRWLDHHPGPVYTTTAYPEWKALVEYPLDDVINYLGGPPYLNNSVAYAIAYAMYIGVKEIYLFGADFTYADNHAAESGRGCCEYLLGQCVARGIRVGIPQGCTMLDAHVPEERKLYGFYAPMAHTFADGKITVTRKDASTNPNDPGPRLAVSNTPVAAPSQDISCNATLSDSPSPPPEAPPLRLEA